MVEEEPRKAILPLIKSVRQKKQSLQQCTNPVSDPLISQESLHRYFWVNYFAQHKSLVCGYWRATKSKANLAPTHKECIGASHVLDIILEE